MRITDKRGPHKSEVHVFFAWYDCWIGVYWDRTRKVLYICPLPMLCVRIRLSAWKQASLNEWRAEQEERYFEEEYA